MGTSEQGTSENPTVFKLLMEVQLFDSLPMVLPSDQVWELPF